MKYFDKHGKQIKAGMTLKHSDGEIQKVYKATDGDLGLNASNEDFPTFREENRQLYSLADFPLKDYEIIKEDN